MLFPEGNPQISCHVMRDLRALQSSFTPINVLSERFATSATYHFHQSLPSLDAFHKYIVNTICKGDGAEPCAQKAESLKSADSLDIDFDSISQTLKVRVFRGSMTWHEEIGRRGAIKIEVGILAPQTSAEMEKQSLEGFLMVLGKDEKLSACTHSLGSKSLLTLE